MSLEKSTRIDYLSADRAKQKEIQPIKIKRIILRDGPPTGFNYDYSVYVQNSRIVNQLRPILIYYENELVAKHLYIEKNNVSTNFN